MALASDSGLRGLETLSLRDGGVGLRGAAALAGSPLAMRLSTLDLSFNRLGDAGAEALAQGPGWARLGDLRVTDNELGMGGTAALLAAPGMEILHAIDISRNALVGVVDLHGLARNQIELLESSFAQVATMGVDFSERFYEALFARYPTVKPLFAKTNMSRQKQHLMAALTTVIENRAPDAIEPSLTALGKHHVGYGVFPSHYHAVSSTLLDVLREVLGPLWCDAMHEAWSDGLEAVTRVMMNAHRQSAVNLRTATTRM